MRNMLRPFGERDRSTLKRESARRHEAPTIPLRSGCSHCLWTNGQCCKCRGGVNWALKALTEGGHEWHGDRCISGEPEATQHDWTLR